MGRTGVGSEGQLRGWRHGALYVQRRTSHAYPEFVGLVDADQGYGRASWGQAVSRQIAVKGYRIKDGKLVKDVRRLDVSARLRQKSSKKIRVVRGKRTA